MSTASCVKKCFYLPFSVNQVLAAVHPVETDVSFDPINVAALGMDRVMVQSHRSADLVQQFRLRLLTVHDPGPILLQELLTRKKA